MVEIEKKFRTYYNDGEELAVFIFFANGAPFGRPEFARQSLWEPDGPGFVTLSVVDAEGRGDTVTVFLN